MPHSNRKTRSEGAFFFGPERSVYFLLRLRRRKTEFVKGQGYQKLNFLELLSFLGKPEHASKTISTSLSYLVLLDRAGSSEATFINFRKRSARAHSPPKTKLFGSGLWRKVLRTMYLFCCACGAEKMRFRRDRGVRNRIF